jgi:DNA-binding GntR family transcriptional regulator
MNEPENAWTKEQIFAEIRRRICLLDYPPGHRLNERELAAAFGVSRTPIRSVLQRLENDGLIESRHGRGTAVTEIGLDRMREIYIVRIRLMDAMADSAPAALPENLLADLAGIEQQSANLLKKHDKRAFALVSMRLHGILHSLTENRVLQAFNDNLFFRSARFWFLLLDHFDFREQADELHAEIQALTRALALPDIRLAAAVHKTHLASVLAHLDHLHAGNALG